MGPVLALALSLVLVAGLQLALGSQAAAVPAGAQTRTAEAPLVVGAAQQVPPPVRYLRQAQRATNNARKRNNRAVFKGDPCLRKWARQHANRLARAGSGLWHQDLGPVMRNCGLRTVGENVAFGYPTGRAVVNQGWLKSPGHRANILNRQFRLSVVVARRDAAGRWYAVQLFGGR